MLKAKTLAGLKAKSRQVAVIPRTVLETRAQVMALIDDFWRYYCNPADYSYKDVQTDTDGNSIEIYVAARWRDTHHIVEHRDGQIVISLRWEGRLLPLTRKGDQEVVLAVATRDVIEQILAEIKHSVKTGAMDEHLLG